MILGCRFEVILVVSHRLRACKAQLLVRDGKLRILRVDVYKFPILGAVFIFLFLLLAFPIISKLLVFILINPLLLTAIFWIFAYVLSRITSYSGTRVVVLLFHWSTLSIRRIFINITVIWSADV